MSGYATRISASSMISSTTASVTLCSSFNDAVISSIALFGEELGRSSTTKGEFGRRGDAAASRNSPIASSSVSSYVTLLVSLAFGSSFAPAEPPSKPDPGKADGDNPVNPPSGDPRSGETLRDNFCIAVAKNSSGPGKSSKLLASLAASSLSCAAGMLANPGTEAVKAKLCPNARVVK